MQTPRRKAAASLGVVGSQLGSYLQRTTRIPLCVAALSLFFLALCIYGEDLAALAELSFWRIRRDFIYVHAVKHKPRPRAPLNQSLPLALPPAACDLSAGRWVFDDASFPLYYEEECRFLTLQVTCARNGRRDDKFQQWRWQPNDCSLPRYLCLLPFAR